MRFVVSAFSTILVAVLSTSISLAGRYEPQRGRVTADSLLIDEILTQVDENARLQSLRSFAGKWPDSPSIGWIYEQMHEILLRTGPWEEALQAGEKLLALDPHDLEAAFRNVRIAETRKDPVLVRKCADRAALAARSVLSKQGATASAELARQILKYSEYLEFLDITQTDEARARLAKMDRFAQTYPESTYTDELESLYFATYEQAGERAKALAFAERLLRTKAAESEDLLFSVAENYFARDTEPDKVIHYGTRALEVMRRKERPDNTSETEWAVKSARIGGRVNWMIGKIYMDRGNYAASDRHLRAALPWIRGNESMIAAVLFHLGWANYKLGNLADAEKFNQSCLAYKGRYQAQAARNLEVIRVERTSAK